MKKNSVTYDYNHFLKTYFESRFKENFKPVIRVKYLNLFFLIFLIHSSLIAQVVVKTLPFSFSSSYPEPDGRREALKLSESEFVTLSKSKGGEAGASEYTLEKYDKDLNSLFKVVLTAGEEEDYKELFFNGTDIVLFSILHENMKQTSKLLAYGFDAKSGAKKWDKVLQEFKINNWVPLKFKGAVRETFENSIGSSITKNFVTPLQYQYDIRFSKDRKKILTYIFDYSQQTLVASAKLWDNNLNLLQESKIPVDNNFINYGIYPNNKGDVFILNVDRLGRMVVVKYNLENKNSDLLDIQYTSTRREGLKLEFLNDDVIYVANTCTKEGGRVTGVMYSKLDFGTRLVEKINYHEISDNMKQTMKLLRQNNKSLVGEETWRGYHITDFFLNEYEKVVIVLEKREITSMTYDFNQSEINDIEKWKATKSAKVSAEGFMIFSFNKDDELLWENVHIKSQVGDVAAGLLSSSYSMNISDEGKIRMAYAFSSNSSGLLNSINYIEWDELTGSKIKELALPNDEGLTMLRSFTMWFEDKVAIAGRKGLLGKKSSIVIYKI